MALQIARPTQFGISATYHKIMKTEIYWHTNHALVMIGSYPNKAARDMNSDPMSTYVFEWIGAEFPFTPESNVLTDSYNKIKTYPEWSTAVDVL